MDMAVANLLKHKIRLNLIREKTGFFADRRRRWFKRTQDYSFQIIENVESISLRDLYSLYINFYKSFTLYLISKALHETRDFSRDGIEIILGVYDLEEDEGYLIFMDNYDLIWESPGWFSDYIEREIYEDDADHLIRGCFYPFIKISSTHLCNTVLEQTRFMSEFNHPGFPEESSDEEEYNQPKQTYREDCCVIC